MLAPLLALAVAAAPAFDAAKAKAKPVESLKKTVSTLVGDCSGAEFEDAIACQENIEKAQKALRKGTYSVWLGPSAEGLLKYEGMRGDKARLLLTPMFDAGGGFALTVGKPLKLDPKAGTPVVKLLVLDGQLVDGQLESDLLRALRLGMVSVEMVGKFGAPWSLKRGDKLVQGVAFEPAYVRFANARTGKPIVDVAVK